MRRTSLVMLAALGCGRPDSESSPRVELPVRAARVGDRFEIEIISRSTGIRAAGGSVEGDSLSATLRYTDEVLAVEDGRATRVRRTFRSDPGTGPFVADVDVRAGRGTGDGKRTDHFRQFERLVPATIPDLSDDPVIAGWNCDGTLGSPPSSVLDISDAAWLDSRCTCTPRREIRDGGRRLVELEIRISFDGDTGPPRLEGTMRFDLDEGLLREVVVRGSTAMRSYELHATQAVAPGASAR